MSTDDDDKKHEAGERQWREAAEQGQLPRSADINAVAVVLAATGASTLFAGSIASAVGEVARDGFSAGGNALGFAEAETLLRAAMVGITQGAAPPLVAALAAGTIASLAQTRGQLATEAIALKWERLDALNGLKQIYMSSMPWIELAKGTAKVTLLAVAVGFGVSAQVRSLPNLAAVGVGEQLAIWVRLCTTAVYSAAPVMIAIAAVDYGATFWRTSKRLMRTDQQAKDDHKEQEGDPRLKSQRRSRARKRAQASSIHAVRTADVVVTNPTHIAVALRYDRKRDAAPIVVAKGVDHLALQIRQEALRRGVPRIEDRPLARALVRCEVGRAVPDALYGPVARVLAVVLRRRRGGR